MSTETLLERRVVKAVHGRAKAQEAQFEPGLAEALRKGY